MSFTGNITTTSPIISTSETPSQKKYSCEDRIISQLIIVDILHSMAYACTFYIWRVMHIEQPNKLAKEVSFLHDLISCLTQKLLFYSYIYM